MGDAECTENVALGSTPAYRHPQILRPHLYVKQKERGAVLLVTSNDLEKAIGSIEERIRPRLLRPLSMSITTEQLVYSQQIRLS